MAGNKHDNGVHEIGTPETLKAYQEDTPGQEVEKYLAGIQEVIQEKKSKQKKSFTQVFQNPLKGFPYNEQVDSLEEETLEEGRAMKPAQIAKKYKREIEMLAKRGQSPEYGKHKVYQAIYNLAWENGDINTDDPDDTDEVIDEYLDDIMGEFFAHMNSHVPEGDSINEVTDKEINAMRKVSKDMQKVLKDYQKIATIGDKELKDTKHNATYKKVLDARDSILTMIGTLQTTKLLRGEEIELDEKNMSSGDMIKKLFKVKNEKEVAGIANLLNMTDAKVLLSMMKQNPKGFKRMAAKMGELPAMEEIIKEGRLSDLLIDIQQGATAKELARTWKIPLSVAKDFLADYYADKRSRTPKVRSRRESVEEGVNGMNGKKIRGSYRPARAVRGKPFSGKLTSHSTIEKSDLFKDVEKNSFDLRDDCNSIAIRVPHARGSEKDKEKWREMVNSSFDNGGSPAGLIRGGGLAPSEVKALFADMKKAASAFGSRDILAQSHEISVENKKGKLNIDKGLNAMLKAIDEFGMRNHVSVSGNDGVLTRIQYAANHLNEEVSLQEGTIQYTIDHINSVGDIEKELKKSDAKILSMKSTRDGVVVKFDVKSRRAAVELKKLVMKHDKDATIQEETLQEKQTYKSLIQGLEKDKKEISKKSKAFGQNDTKFVDKAINFLKMLEKEGIPAGQISQVDFVTNRVPKFFVGNPNRSPSLSKFTPNDVKKAVAHAKKMGIMESVEELVEGKLGDSIIRRDFPNVWAASAKNKNVLKNFHAVVNTRNYKQMKDAYKKDMKSFVDSFKEEVAEGKMDGMKLTGQEISVYFRRNPVRDKTVKKAVEIALDHGGAMNYAIKKIEKLKRGMSKNKDVQKALNYINYGEQYRVNTPVIKFKND